MTNTRIASRLSGEYIMRSLRLLTEWSGGDVLTVLVTMAVAQANTAHLDEGGGPGAAFADTGTPPPDELRRPVSVLTVAAALGLPYETTRRHVQKMVNTGQCVRVKGGVIFSVRNLEGPAHEAMLRSNLANLRRLCRALRAAGVDTD
jgi:hypothetical protein